MLISRKLRGNSAIRPTHRPKTLNRLQRVLHRPDAYPVGIERRPPGASAARRRRRWDATAPHDLAPANGREGERGGSGRALVMALCESSLCILPDHPAHRSSGSGYVGTPPQAASKVKPYCTPYREQTRLGSAGYNRQRADSDPA